MHCLSCHGDTGRAHDPPTSSRWARGIWGTNSSQVFALGNSGEVLKFDGTQWSQVRPSSDNSFYRALHGVSARLFAVGYAGVVMVTR